MSMNFQTGENRFANVGRKAHTAWVRMIRGIVDVRGKRAIDLGCGNGIYTWALADMGAEHVTGVDSAEEAVLAATKNRPPNAAVDFVLADALQTGLQEHAYDTLLMRDLLSHLDRGQISRCIQEAARLLKRGGSLLIQDQTPEDCLLPGSTTHIRGYFFMRYSRLKAKEVRRQPEDMTIRRTFQDMGFAEVESQKLWEIERVYTSYGQLRSNLLARQGYALLSELTDAELIDLTKYIEAQVQLSENEEVIEQARWTVWSAVTS